MPLSPGLHAACSQCMLMILSRFGHGLVFWVSVFRVQQDWYSLKLTDPRESFILSLNRNFFFFLFSLLFSNNYFSRYPRHLQSLVAGTHSGGLWDVNTSTFSIPSNFPEKYFSRNSLSVKLCATLRIILELKKGRNCFQLNTLRMSSYMVSRQVIFFP